MSSFVNLHVHTGYSLQDAMIRIDPLVERVADLGQQACAITDHGTLAGVVKFSDACIKKNIKPVLGLEAYIAPDTRFRKHYAKGEHSASHLILFAKNDAGWRNLMALSTKAFVEGFYKKPRIDHALLKEHAEGLIVSSACIGGDIAVHLKSGMDPMGDSKTEFDEALARAKIAWYTAIFGDDFYLEMQSYGAAYQERVNDWYRAHIPSSQLICTSDCHYLHREDADTHDTLLAMGTVKAKGDPERWRFKFDDSASAITDQFYLKTEDEMLDSFTWEEIENTKRLADKIEFELPLRKKFFMPELPADIKGDDSVQTFLHECEAGLRTRLITAFPDRYGDDRENFKPYWDRLNYEMDVFIKAGFVEYALLLWDLVRFCQTRDIFTGDGRGSGAGSLVLYSLRITNVDPVARDCPFERFINAGRLERFAPPDVDLDFPQSRRQEVIDYLRQRYGAERVCQIGTYATLGPAALVRKLGVPLQIDHGAINRLTGVIPTGESSVQGSGAAGEASGLTLDDLYLTVPRFKDEIDKLGDTGKWLLHYARGLAKLGTHASTHASGVLITDRPVSELVPLMNSKDDNVMAQVDMFDAEALGLVKFDILGLKTLDVMEYVDRKIRENDDPNFTFDSIDLDDPLPYQLLAEGRTVGVFQAEGGGFGRLIPQTRPTSVEHLAALTSLCRPGPSISGITDTYVKRARGTESVTYEIPQLEPILGRNLGCIVFQEDIMNIAHKLAGYTLAEADDLRKIMGKKQRDKMPKQRVKFLSGLEEHSGVSPAKGEKLWAEIATMAEYVFNRSHAMAYSYTTAKCAWSKAYYPAYFLAGAMTSEVKGDSKELPTLLQDARFLNVTLMAPDINESQENYEAINKEAIRVGLLGIHQVGEKAVEAILLDRTLNGPYKSKDDFRSRLPQRTVNSRVMAALERAGAFDKLEGRQRLVTTERLFEEFELFNFFLSGHPCQRLRKAWQQEDELLVTIHEINQDETREAAIQRTPFGNTRKWVYREKKTRAVVTKIEQKKSKRDSKIMLFIDFEDETGSAKMILNQRSIERFGFAPVKGQILEMTGRKADPDRWHGYFEPESISALNAAVA